LNFFSSLTSIISIQPPLPPPQHPFVVWNGTWNKKKGWDWSFEDQNEYVCLLRVAMERKGMHLVRHKRQAQDEEETKFCAKKWRTNIPNNNQKHVPSIVCLHLNVW